MTNKPPRSTLKNAHRTSDPRLLVTSALQSTHLEDCNLSNQDLDRK
jgi:hypothetical protein